MRMCDVYPVFYVCMCHGNHTCELYIYKVCVCVWDATIQRSSHYPKSDIFVNCHHHHHDHRIGNSRSSSIVIKVVVICGNLQ